MHSIGRIGCAATLCTVIAGFASASEIGKFSALMSNTYDFASIEIAGTHVIAGSLQGTITITESTGDPFNVGEHSASACVAYVKQSETGMELEAPCVLTDAAGDSLHLMLRRSEGSVGTGGGGEGHSQIVGGTGAYSGITGTCSYEANYIGEHQVVGLAVCDWQRP